MTRKSKNRRNITQPSAKLGGSDRLQSAQDTHAIPQSQSMNRLGLVLCALYGTVIAVCVALAMTAGGDPKGRFVFLQLPIALQASALDALGLGWLIERLTWGTAYLALAIPTLAMLYLAGRFVSGRFR